MQMRKIIVALMAILMTSFVAHAQGNAAGAARAEKVINEARAALGGETALKSVVSLSISGTFRNFAPRVTLAWSPFQDGKAVIRAGAGIFYSWFAADAFEQTLRVDGRRQADIVVRNPGFPDPFTGGTQIILPPSRIQRDPTLRMPYIEQFSIGLERPFEKFILRSNYFYQRGVGLMRGHNINAPRPGLGRPDPNAGNINQIESTANSMFHLLNLNLAPIRLAGRINWIINYTLSKVVNEADGPLSLPADNFNLRAERGPALWDARHRLFAMLNLRLTRSLRLSSIFSANSSMPYNITTGFDNNGDTISNDRPAGVGRNSARGAPRWDLSVRLNWGFGFGKAQSPPQVGKVGVTRVGGDADSLGSLSPPDPGLNRWRMQFYIQAYNLFNHTNLTHFAGVQTSPFFGQATSALPGRRIEIGTRFSF